MGQQQIQSFLINRVVDKMTEFLTIDYALTVAEALDVVYNSETYLKLQDTDTDLYTQSPAYVYELLNTEYQTGIFQNIA